jgi:hypothetical protein
MKQILSLFMFGIGALLFLAFFATFKPTDVTAASQHESPAYARLPITDTCRSVVA